MLYQFELFKEYLRAWKKSKEIHGIIVPGEVGIGKCIYFSPDDFMISSEGKSVTIKDKPKEIITLNENTLKLEKSKVINYYKRKINRLIYLELKSGKSLSLTPEHPLYTIKGWKEVNKLKTGEFVATPRKFPITPTREIRECEVKIIAYLLAEGHLGQSISFTKKDQVILDDFESAIKEFHSNLKIYKALRRDIPTYIVRQKKVKHNPNKFTNPIKIYLNKLGLLGKRSGDKFIPNHIMTLSNKQIKLFLGILYSCDGFIGKKREIQYCSKSKLLIKQIQHLLLRFSIVSTSHARFSCASNSKNKIKRLYYYLDVSGKTDVLKFINFFSESFICKFKKERLLRIKKDLENIKENTNKDIIPFKEYIRKLKIKYRESFRDEYGRFKKGYKCSLKLNSQKVRQIDDRNTDISRESAKDYTNYYPDKRLKKLADSDIFWDKITKIEIKDGNFDVYDIEVEDNHNFIVNDIIVHNSFEIEKCLKDEEYELVNSHTTPLKLYITLYNTRNSFLVIDDVLELFKSKDTSGLLIAATQTGIKPRVITWHTTSEKLGVIPYKFNYKGKIGIICNRLPTHLDHLKSRCFYFELKLSYTEMIEKLEEVSKGMRLSDKLIKFIKRNTDESTAKEILNIRLLIKLNSLFKEFPNKWQELGLYLIKQDKRLYVLKRVIEKYANLEDQIQAYKKLTNRQRSSFYKDKAKLS